MSKLRIAPDLTLPLEATTQAIGIVAKRRVGKSYTARRFYEQLLKNGQQVVIVDPKGDHWGIRSSADGKSPGFPVVILGGEHGDVPLEPGGGEIVAKLVVEERVSVLLDLSHFRKRELAVFMADFLETLYRLKAKESLRTAMMLIIDEADAIAPQKPNPGEERMLGAAEDIVRRGGQRGIGCMMITQRTAVLNKNVLTQCEMLIALRTISPQDLKAMQAWIDVHGTIEERDTLMASLPSLPQGDAWFWSPGWPTEKGIFQRVHVSPIETFDSGATPKSGEKRIAPKTVADVDLGAISRQMAETIAKAKADDPKELRKEIAELKRSLAANVGVAGKEVERLLGQEYAKGFADGEIRGRHSAMVDLRQVVDRQTKAMTGAVLGLGVVTDQVSKAWESMQAYMTPTQNEIDAKHRAERIVARAPEYLPQSFVASKHAAGREIEPRPSRAPKAESNGDLNRSEQKILDALALMKQIGVPLEKTNLGFFTGYADGGRFTNLLGSLRTKGYVEPTRNDGKVIPTAAGDRAGNAADVPIRSHDDLHNLWLSKLPASEGKVLRVLLDAYPTVMPKSRLGELTDYDVNGGRFGNILGRLRSLGAIDYPVPGSVAATDTLFPEGLR